MTKKKIMIAAAVILAAGLITGGIFLGLYLKELNDYKNKMKNFQISYIDISELSDGIYTGSYDAGFIYAEVKVTVITGIITEILLVRHNNDRGAAAEIITDRVIQEQSLAVDGIAGATNSSKTILKAIEEALKSNPEPLN